jgi:hypothetical protein
MTIKLTAQIVLIKEIENNNSMEIFQKSKRGQNIKMNSLIYSFYNSVPKKIRIKIRNTTRLTSEGTTLL